MMKRVSYARINYMLRWSLFPVVVLLTANAALFAVIAAAAEAISNRCLAFVEWFAALVQQ